MLYNKKADKEQLARYKKRLRGEAPQSISEFQSLKYREPEKYSELKEYYRYKNRVPAAKIDISNISSVNDHAFRHGGTLADAKKYIKNAKVSITTSRWDGLSLNYYSDDGAVYVDYTTKRIKTMYSKENYDPKIKSMMEEFG